MRWCDLPHGGAEIVLDTTGGDNSPIVLVYQMHAVFNHNRGQEDVLLMYCLFVTCTLLFSIFIICCLFHILLRLCNILFLNNLVKSKAGLFWSFLAVYIEVVYIFC